MHDIVIRGGTIVDGTGAPRTTGDVAIDGGIIVETGRVEGRGTREIDADGLIVTPGFVDIHTHYDGQATWDSLLAPSSWHGVTSVVMGNCGVGFAPARPDRHDFLISLMEGVEDIPGTALAEGLPWNWESLPEYFDAVDRLPHAIDMGAQIPHAALRAFVMGERGADHTEDPSPEEIAEMARLSKEALAAGAIGFASSRTVNHRTKAGAHVGSLTASTEELLGIGQAFKEMNRGVFQFVSDWTDLDVDLGLFYRIAQECGRPVSIGLAEADGDPGRWRQVLGFMERAADEGVDLKAQVCVRPVGILMGLQTSLNPLMYTPSYEAIADLPLAERVRAMRNPELRQRIVGEFEPVPGQHVRFRQTRVLHKIFRLGDPPDYEPPADASLAALAQARDVAPAEVVYDALLENDGKQLLYYPMLNYARFNLDAAREMSLSKQSLFGLSDGGAHVATICDGSFPTYHVSYWCRDRKRGPQLELEDVVRRQTRDAARHVGWHDRGVIAPGYKADLNVFDFDRLGMHAPEVVYDLPSGSPRLLQKAKGYHQTIKAGVVTFEHGEPTGALPGHLVRGPQAAPRV
jgi:N-acyl-D-aspartate/D-glutamate deacylase